jgi:hypothetical protein
MVAEEVPHVFCPRREKVGVKRSREQRDRPVAAAAPVRPALDADLARAVNKPTMATETTGATSPSTNSACSTRLPGRPRSLMTAAVLAAVADDSEPADRFVTEAGLTHGLLV